MSMFLDITTSDCDIQSDQVHKSSKLRKKNSYLQDYHCKLSISLSQLDSQSLYPISEYLLNYKLSSFHKAFTIAIFYIRTSNLSSSCKIFHWRDDMYWHPILHPLIKFPFNKIKKLKNGNIKNKNKEIKVKMKRSEK